MRVPTGKQEIPSSSPHRPSILDKGKSPIHAPAPIKLPYFNSLGVRFNYELDDACYESEKCFKLLTSYAQAISEIYLSSGNQEIPRSVMDQRAYANFTATDELDRDYWTQYKEIIGNSPQIVSTQEQPVASMSKIHVIQHDTSPLEVQTSTPIRSPHVGPAATSTGYQEQVQNPKLKSPLAATVTEATEEDSIVYLGLWKAEPRPKTPKPLETMHYPSYLRVAESGPSKEWTDRVVLQRLRNSETCDYSHSNIADQCIGFDEDSNPVDKDTAPREVWDRDF
ncbi:hypothetical protein L218DRAFT_949938 [Marasmius fiardii PR-910]|nr:hypothetical protein L218DRAFT_951750 [Marasmius fiardii PR-910]KAF9256469.1 hypothetical protein L218DRAFT_949938 [Marasmius fiardii PR-910]